jgi:hypothetical protein
MLEDLSKKIIVMTYTTRSHITIPKGPYTWITNFCIFTSISWSLYTSATNDMDDDEQNYEVDKKPFEYAEELSRLLSIFISKNAMFPMLLVKVVFYVRLNIRLVWILYSTGEWDIIVNKFTFLQ